MMTRYFDNEEPNKMVLMYPTLIESIIEFKIYLRKSIPKNELDKYLSKDVEELDISDQYRLLKDRGTNQIFCCKHD